MTDTSYEPTHEFKTLVDAIIAKGVTCQTLLVILDERLAKTPDGQGKENLLQFRKELVAKINAAI